MYYIFFSFIQSDDSRKAITECPALSFINKVGPKRTFQSVKSDDDNSPFRLQKETYGMTENGKNCHHHASFAAS